MIASRGIAICVAALAAFAILTVTALGAPKSSGSGLPKDADLLFALASESGTFEKSKDRPKGTFQLKLRDLAAATLWFTDRPERDSGTIPTPRFFAQWERLGFDDDPPNAVVSLVGGADRADTVALELRHPRLSKSGTRLRLTVKLLDDTSPGLAHLADDLDGQLQRRFEDATLFIDDASTSYAPCTLGDVYYMSGGEFEQWEFPNLLPAKGWMLPVEEYPDLFAAIGTQFGGDGQKTFELPTLTGPAPGVYPFVCTLGERAQVGGVPEPACRVGEIRLTADLRSVPPSWFPTDGRILQVAEHPVLFSLIGASFGGDGETTFALPTVEPPSGLNSQICFLGTYPSPNKAAAPKAFSRGGAAPDGSGVIENAYLAGVRLRASDFAPVGTAITRGQLMSLSQNTALFSLLSTTFGGNGKSDFALPNIPSPQAPMLNWIVNLQGIYPERE